eukprot:10238920-Lingulodinium_polyedra.AAC.1
MSRCCWPRVSRAKPTTARRGATQRNNVNRDIAQPAAPGEASRCTAPRQNGPTFAERATNQPGHARGDGPRNPRDA